MDGDTMVCAVTRRLYEDALTTWAFYSSLDEVQKICHEDDAWKPYYRVQHATPVILCYEFEAWTPSKRI